MALTRKFLKALGIDEEKIDEIISAHTETVDGLKAERDKYKGDAEMLPAVQKELNDLKAVEKDGYEEKYNALKSEYDKYKEDVTAKATAEKKTAAVKAYFESKGITEHIALALKSSRDEQNALTLNEDGTIKDTKALDDLIAGELASLVTVNSRQGAATNTPPPNSGDTPDFSKMSDEEYYAYRKAQKK